MRKLLLIGLLAACGADAADDTNSGNTTVGGADSVAAQAEQTNVSATAPTGAAVTAAGDTLPPNELGRFPVLEYHLIGDTEARWTREKSRFRKDLEFLYARGFRPVTMSEMIDKNFDLPRGLSPAVFVFDDASPSQFRYIEQNGKLVIDPNSALGIWEDFAKDKPDWRAKGTWCVLSGAEAGRSFFGDKGIEGQKSEWRHQKIKYLVEQGHEICNHTLWHAQLSKYPDAFVQEQIARLQLAVDSAVPGYRMRTLALPLGLWPKNKQLAWQGSWTDPKSGKTVSYKYDAVLEVSGGPARSPHDPQFNGHSVNRLQAYQDWIEREVDKLDAAKNRYVSDGDPRRVAR